MRSSQLLNLQIPLPLRLGPFTQNNPILIVQKEVDVDCPKGITRHLDNVKAQIVSFSFMCTLVVAERGNLTR